MSKGLLGACQEVLGGVSGRNRFFIVAAGAFGLVGAGLILGVIYRLHPCPLCIFQRVLYLLIGTVALLGAVFFAKSGIRWCAAGLGVAAAIGGLATAAYQTWMQLFPESVNECGFSEPNLIERFVEWLGPQWEFMFLATGLCSSQDWTFLGLSMANWSVPCFLALGGLLVWAVRGR